MPSHNAKPERNARLYAAWVAGASQADLARQEGISRAHVHQIVRRQERIMRHRLMAAGSEPPPRWPLWRRHPKPESAP